jgi:hypothetical protein
MTKALSTVLIICAAVFCTSCIFSTSSTTVKGRVHKGQEPVANAEVSFGGTLAEAKTTTGPDGRFTLTAKHRPTQILTLSVTKSGLTQREEIKFPGFAAPEKEIEVEMMTVIERTR